MIYKWTEKISKICEELSPHSLSASIKNKIRSIDADFFSKYNVKDVSESHAPEKVSFVIDTDKLKLQVEITESDENVDKYNLKVTDVGNGALNEKIGIFLEDSIRILNTMINTKSNAMNEYEKGDLKAISDKSRANLSNDTKMSSPAYDDGEIEDLSPTENKSKTSSNNKPIGTNSNVVDAAARTVGSGMSSLRGEPKKMSDFIKHMRAQIPDFDELVRTNPRFIQGVRKIDPNAERDLKKITNDTN